VSEVNLQNAGSDAQSATVIEGLSIQFTPAPIPKRILAYVIDVSIVSMLLYLVLIVVFIVGFGGAFGVASLSKGLSDGLMIGGAVFFLVVLLLGTAAVWHGYFCYFELKQGTTPGKKILGLRVIPLTSARLTMGQVVLRDMFRYIDAVLVLPGLITMLLNAKRQRLGDMAAGTLVIYSKEKEAKTKFLYVSSEDFYALSSALEPAPIPRDACQAFLRFSYPLFISGKANYTQAEIEQWITYVKAYVKAPEADAVDSTLLLRFFAELCVQAINFKGGK
jgi:uncharacterized RDD family membrane protein YckC